VTGPETSKDVNSVRQPAADSGPAAEPFGLPCIRCGVCCTVYQVRISPAEAIAIAGSMGMERWDWVGRYCDPRWHDTRRHLIRHDEDGCVFLDRSRGDVALCSIYSVRPSACRDWAAGVFKPACQDGLRRYWQVEVDDEGQLRGSEEALARLDTFLHSL